MKKTGSFHGSLRRARRSVVCDVNVSLASFSFKQMYGVIVIASTNSEEAHEAVVRLLGPGKYVICKQKPKLFGEGLHRFGSKRNA